MEHPVLTIVEHRQTRPPLGNNARPKLAVTVPGNIQAQSALSGSDHSRISLKPVYFPPGVSPHG